ncbi:MAG TPA: aminotransferase class V-fold PLP-dependent enzyme [Candidatus Eisenbacteria bacterium]|nr:aminotransferase class V-fold PLP-dependent enzyme [Candidatus Eisenbacteria bacterium]
MNDEEFRRFGHALVEWVADYRRRMPELPVMSPVAPGEIRRRFPAAPPRQGGGFADVAAALDRDVVPGITHWNHPAFFAYFPSNTSYAAILADLVASGLGAQCMSWETSPAATELEEVVMEWLRQIVDLPASFTGVIHDTASTATLCALLCARERATGYAQEQRGLQDGGPPLVVYASDQAHFSVLKAARLAGFGGAHVRAIETDDAHALRPDALEAALARDVRAGMRPCAIVATTGTTGTTALDPVGEIAALAGRHGAWLHVDGALAGIAMALPECRWMWRGIERADSVVLNPHKWMGVGFDLSAYFVRDPEHLVRVMGARASYIRTAHDREVKNFRDWGIPLGRRFRALKLWFLLADIGVEGLQERLRRDLANAQWLKSEVERAPGWELLAPVPLQTVVMRHRPEGVRDEAWLTRHNLAIAARVNEGGSAYLTPSMLKARQSVRVSIGAETTQRAHVAAVWQALQSAAVQDATTPA